MRIPDETIEQIRKQSNIVDIIGDYVRLRRTGKNWIGLCPFHEDRNPSFAVEPVRGIYKCFACGKGGDVFAFLMDSNHWSFPQVVRYLGEKYHVEIPENEDQWQSEFTESERYSSAIREAARYFYSTLCSDAGKEARDYLQERSFTNETLLKFGIGYAREDWDGLIRHVTPMGFSHEEMERAGLIIRREGKEGWYDRFRGRVMFPVFTVYGKVAGFGARILTSRSDQPKYLNSPESTIYQKSQLLYGLYQAKGAIRKSERAILVEGYSDVLMLHQAGIETAVATCGIAVTADHAKALSRFAKNVVVMFDGDRSGNMASYRGIDVLLKEGLDVSVMRLPQGEDPDSFIRQHGVESFEKQLKDSVPFLDFRLHECHRTGEFDTVEKKAEAIRGLVRTIAQIPDTLKQELLIQQLSASMRVSEKEIAKVLRDAKASGSAKLRGQQTVVQVRAKDQFDYPHAEFRLLSMLVQGDRVRFEKVLQEIDPSDFTNPVTRQCVELLLERYCNGASFAVEQLLRTDISDELREFLPLLVVPMANISQKWSAIMPDVPDVDEEKMTQQCVIYLLKVRLKVEWEKILAALQSIEDEPGDESEKEVKKVLLFRSAEANRAKFRALEQRLQELSR